ncbi:MAG: rRNA maturation RNase YbeY [Lachnospiraceae bacterium]|nr:rRNA maturation RNase YbeY [Lachnospiraceae bacterium]
MTIHIEEDTEINFDFDHKGLAKDVILFTMKHENFPFEAELNLNLVDNDSICAMNRAYRQIDRPTDVLSFPMLSYEQPGDFSTIDGQAAENVNPDTGEILLGDIVLSVPKVLQQAQEYGHSVRREYAFLIVHSMLHLFGYDHMTEADAAYMENKQTEILQGLQILR